MPRKPGLVILFALGMAFLSACLLVACPKSAPKNRSVTTFPTALNFGRSTHEATLTLTYTENLAGPIPFEIHADKSWLSSTPSRGTFSASSPFPMTVTVCRAFMKPGGNTGQLTVLVDGVESATVPVRAEAVLAADFIAASTDVLVGDPVLFNDISRVLTGADPITQWQWDFGDGVVSAQQNPVHTYVAPGKYTVRLHVQSATLSDTRTRNTYIHVKKVVRPRAQFAAASRNPRAEEPLAFTDLSIPGTSPITGWTWNFGDGGWSRLQNPVHIYRAAAVYDVYLTVAGAEGDDTEIKLGYIDVQPALPMAEFAADPTTPLEGEPVVFSDLSISSGAPIAEWLWDFGDGTTSFESNPSHVYERAGRYTVILNVRSNAGADTERKSDYVNVQPKVAAT